MNNNLAKIVNSNWFFLSVLGFALVLPLSQGLVSVMAGVMLLTALIEDNWQNKKKRLYQNRYLLFIPVIFLIYLLSSALTFKNGEPLYDLQKTLFYLVIPLAFIFGKSLTTTQQRTLFYAFATSIAISTWVGIINWILIPDAQGFSVHQISLVSHIRFSFQLILIFWFFILFFQYNHKRINRWQNSVVLILAVYFLGFLMFQQSLTGLVAFGASLVFYLGYLVFQVKSKKKYIFLVMLAFTILMPIMYVAYVIHNFYDFEQVDKSNIEKTTSEGNPYRHDFNNLMVENGHYVYLYICESEMREEWNKISKIKYDSIGGNGYPISATLIRYLTSKGLKKDADGILTLTDSDRKNIESGMANVIYTKKKYSLYPRIYQTVWEYYMYTITGDPNYQSFSQRIEFAKAALYIIKNHLWFGVGTGNWKKEFKNAFIKNNSKLNENLYASSHNQYLNYMVKFGIVGFILILFFLIYPIIKTRSYFNLLFLLLLVFMCFANFADSNLESHMGSSFFTFFYSFFLVSNNKSWLKLEKGIDSA